MKENNKFKMSWLFSSGKEADLSHSELLEGFADEQRTQIYDLV
ncbi:hypothetical protein CLSA_c38880 [Clostridium saccharobutylicum DSM 13864]|uniref:Uncharacterized protein n=1 Tax=Clostridium saccharobutylicum DSM 13864 TaxID=1345695 RepID=U5MWB9_CLOSA|nr:hypothetical protein CLSA_c38880 [Clostridium saccharobutylicum DSM 13864]